MTLVQPELVSGGSVESTAASFELPLYLPTVGLVLIVLGSVFRYASAVEGEASWTV